MELLINSDQYIIKFPSQWTILSLILGLSLFMTSRFWRERLQKKRKPSFLPGILFTISLMFFISGLHFYVYKIVIKDEQLILFNFEQFNQKISWSEIHKISVIDNHKIQFRFSEHSALTEPLLIDLSLLDKASVDKVVERMQQLWILKQPVNTQLNHKVK